MFCRYITKRLSKCNFICFFLEREKKLTKANIISTMFVFPDYGIFFFFERLQKDF